jgi:15-O-acetyltransferase Tri3
MGANFPRFPPLVAEDYNWHTCKTDPSILQRRAVGAEVPNGSGELTQAGANDLYVWATLQFDDPNTTLTSLRAKFTVFVLPLLRYDHPEIGCSYVWDGDKSPFI